MNTPTTFERFDPVTKGYKSKQTDRLIASDGWKFTTDMWVPSIRELAEADTVGKCIESIGNTALRVANLHDRYSLRGKSLFVSGALDKPIEAWFKWDAESEGRFTVGSLSSVLVDYDLRIGLPTPVEGRRNAFAVIDKVLPSMVTSEHEVTHSADEPIGSLLEKTRAIAVNSLVSTLNTRYPGFDLYDRLTDVGISL